MRIVVVVALGTALLGCRPKVDVGPIDLNVEWAGTEQGHFVGRLAATHCRETGIVELIALRGDTGIAGALFLADSSKLASGVYPVFISTTVTEPRPGALAAARWFTSTLVAAYEAIGGVIQVESGDTVLSGKLDLHMQSVERQDTLHLTGRFDRVRVVRADTSCRSVMRRNIL
jgi:hypothetical protein